MQSPARRAHIADVQVLRALAVGLVIFWHLKTIPGMGPLLPASVTHWLSGGAGVDLFFVISGFVIARSLIPSLENAHQERRRWPTVAAFWVRRLFRLTPSVWFWLAFILLGASLTSRPILWQSVETNLWATLSVVLHYANFRFATHFMVEPIGTSFPYWSLSLEEQFYFLLPLIILVTQRRWRLTLVLIGIIAVQFLITRNILGIMFRSEGLALGVLIALFEASPYHRRWEPKFLKNPYIGLPIIIGLICFIVMIGSRNAQDLFGLSSSRSFNLIALGSSIIVLIASFNEDYIFPKGKVQTILSWLGDRSYALYLCHIPIFYLSLEVTEWLLPPDMAYQPKGLVAVGIAVPLMVIASQLNYRYIEQPLTARGRTIAQRLLHRPNR